VSDPDDRLDRIADRVAAAREPVADPISTPEERD